MAREGRRSNLSVEGVVGPPPRKEDLVEVAPGVERLLCVANATLPPAAPLLPPE